MRSELLLAALAVFAINIGHPHSAEGQHMVTSELSPGIAEWMHTAGHGPLDDLDPAPSEPALPPVTWPAQLGEHDMMRVLTLAGVPVEWWQPFRDIAWSESRWSPGAVGDSGNSLGIMQLWHGWFREGEDPFDPVTNAKVAVRVREQRGRFGGGGGWSAADLLGIP